MSSAQCAGAGLGVCAKKTDGAQAAQRGSEGAKYPPEVPTGAGAVARDSTDAAGGVGGRSPDARRFGVVRIHVKAVDELQHDVGDRGVAVLDRPRVVGDDDVVLRGAAGARREVSPAGLAWHARTSSKRKKHRHEEPPHPLVAAKRGLPARGRGAGHVQWASGVAFGCDWGPSVRRTGRRRGPEGRLAAGDGLSRLPNATELRV